jgi:pSer/pThr/pTyr-binding forkhead associated (FHA) protein
MAGKDFTVRPGENMIGRAPDAAVALAGDSSIADRDHAVLLYDSRGNFFALRPGAETRDSSVNGQPIETSVALRAGDKLRFGATTLVFIPLAGERFRWP